MKRFKNHLIASAVLSMLAIIGTIMNSHQAAAQPPGPPGGLAVNIVNPVPVPVTGSTTVSGNVAATQSGTWAVFARNVDEPGHQPYQQEVVFTFPPGCAPICTKSLNFSPVPQGKRLVVKAVSGEINL